MQGLSWYIKYENWIGFSVVTFLTMIFYSIEEFYPRMRNSNDNKKRWVPLSLTDSNIVSNIEREKNDQE